VDIGNSKVGSEVDVGDFRRISWEGLRGSGFLGNLCDKGGTD
jgi:hypothetical protein